MSEGDQGVSGGRLRARAQRAPSTCRLPGLAGYSWSIFLVGSIIAVMGFALTKVWCNNNTSERAHQQTSQIMEQYFHTEKSSMKVLNGRPASQDRFPYVIWLTVEEEFICSGFLLDPFHALTAAHCVDGYQEQHSGRVHYSQHQVVDLESVMLHPNYVNWHTKSVWDAAIIRLKNPVKKVKFPRIGNLQDTLEQESLPLVLGYGKSVAGSGIVQPKLHVALTLEVVSNKTCGPYNDLDDHHLCLFARGNNGAPSANTCEGDSGGPVIVLHPPNGIWENGSPGTDTVIAITAFGENCENLDSYGVYTRTDELQAWIEATTKGYVWDQTLSLLGLNSLISLSAAILLKILLRAHLFWVLVYNFFCPVNVGERATFSVLIEVLIYCSLPSEGSTVVIALAKARGISGMQLSYTTRCIVEIESGTYVVNVNFIKNRLKAIIRLPTSEHVAVTSNTGAMKTVIEVCRR